MQDRAGERELPLFFEYAARDISDESYMVYSSIVRFLKQAERMNRGVVLDFLSGVSLDEERERCVREAVLS
jgi:hypothetical protein